MTVMGALGYLLRKFDFETAPVVLGLILRADDGDELSPVAGDVVRSYAIFVNRPIASVMLFCGFVLLLLRPPAVPQENP